MEEQRVPLPRARKDGQAEYLAAPASTAGVGARVLRRWAHAQRPPQVDEGLDPGALSLRPLQHPLSTRSFGFGLLRGVVGVLGV